MALHALLRRTNRSVNISSMIKTKMEKNLTRYLRENEFRRGSKEDSTKYMHRFIHTSKVVSIQYPYLKSTSTKRSIKAPITYYKTISLSKKHIDEKIIPSILAPIAYYKTINLSIFKFQTRG